VEFQSRVHLGRDGNSRQSSGSLQRVFAPAARLLSAQDQHLCKKTDALQTRLDVCWLFHNFVRPHFTTKIVPAVALNILDVGLSLAQLFQIRPLNFAEHPT
jgi:hypothetical protein